MSIRYKIRFEEGGVTITQSVTADEPVLPKEKEEKREDNQLKPSFSPQAAVAARSGANDESGSGEPSSAGPGGGPPRPRTEPTAEPSSSTTGGGAPLPGITIVVGSLVIAGASTLGSGEPTRSSAGGQPKAVASW